MIAGLSLIQRIAGGFLIGALLFAVLAWKMADRRADKFEAQAIKLSAELKRISTAKNVQRETTKETIGKARIIYRDAEKVAQRIEASPPNGKCETPASIMGADL